MRMRFAPCVMAGTDALLRPARPFRVKEVRGSTDRDDSPCRRLWIWPRCPVQLPNGAKCRSDEWKIRDYCLSSLHPRGKHKARVFESALGLAAADAPLLIAALRQDAQEQDAVPSCSDEHGSRFTVDFHLEVGSRSARIRSCWIVRSAEDFARLTTCYVL